ncbi:PREDICTED: cytotoxic T-lymphocyte protein 4-like [Gekko japonicus]|uniref:Cytotoxic T-lymphocyte protein 4 n=1 Tax=Gekko japonicus TaxID=146911 RepID=A0ABM1K8I9_GEKJA|nr:PREDICTED: cytotoxic T-lymphocyte protein 4-like [Gekko japonicus]
MISLFTVIVLSSVADGIPKVMEVTQPAFLVVKREEAVHFICDYSCAGDAKQFQITLHRRTGNQSVQICASSFTTKYEPSLMEEPIRCQVRPSHNRVNLTLWGLQATDAGLYFCQMERIYPPPYYPVMGSGTQLYVIDPEPCVDLHLYLWIVTAVASGLLAYSVLITAFLLRKAVLKRVYSVPGTYMKIAPM